MIKLNGEIAPKKKLKLTTEHDTRMKVSEGAPERERESVMVKCE